MKQTYSILIILLLGGCTSTRSLSKKFSEKPVKINHQLPKSYYSNKSANKGHLSLWQNLSTYRIQKDTLPPIPEDASLCLKLVTNNSLVVTAYVGTTPTSSFDIPVKKRGKYLILKRKLHLIPIPILFFHMEEKKAILVPLENEALGYSNYHSETLAILFFGASQTSKSTYEYQAIQQVP